MIPAKYITTTRLPLIILAFLAFTGACRKDDAVGTGSGDGSVTDADGNRYRTVMIDGQEWMAENLRTTRYNDGSPIESPGTSSTAWAGNRNGAYSWYKNDRETYGDKYGALYNWHAVNSGRLCPAGWHVPTDEEWTEINRHIVVNAGGKMKASGGGWNGTNAEAAGETGFDALPGGVRLHSLSGKTTSVSGGFFYHEGRTGRWWTSSAESSAEAWHRSIHAGSGSIYRSHSPKGNGYSVRCIRD